MTFIAASVFAVRRPLQIVAAVLLAVISTNGTRVPLPAIPADPPPATLRPLEVSGERFGELTLRRAWSINLADRRLGGFSTIASVEENRAGALAFTFVTDAGRVLDLALTAERRVAAQRWRRMRAVGAAFGTAVRLDSESMIPATGARGGWVAGLEAPPRLALLDNALSVVATRRDPPMRRWTSNSGPEGLVRLRDGRLLVFAERAASASGVAGRSLLIYPADPFARGAAAPVEVAYDDAARGAVTDATRLSDGRVLILHRRGDPFRGWTSTLAVADPRELRPNAAWRARTIARIEHGPWRENFEGVAVTGRGGDSRVWLISDDNFHRLQRSLLLELSCPDR